MVLIMPSEEIRVPRSVWSSSYLEQNQEYIIIGLFLILLVLILSPLIFLYSKRKPPLGWRNWIWLTSAIIGFSFASLYAGYLMAWYFGDFGLSLTVILISIAMLRWSFKRLTMGAYAIRALGVLLLLIVALDLFQPRVASVPQAAKRMACASNLKSLASVLIEANSKTMNLDLPPPHNQPVQAGGPDVSWRVKLLPFLSLDHVYRNYDLSSSWDSDKNWPIATQKVDSLSCPSEPNRRNSKGGRFTSYVMLENTNKNSSNPNLLYDQNRKLLDSHRILLIESCGANVLWTEPRDADVDTLRWSFKPANRQEENEPWRSKNVGSSGHSGIVQIAFGDGSVRCIPKKIDDDVLKKLLLGGLPSDEDLDQ